MSIISCIISRLKREEQPDTYVHFEQTATLREIVTTIDSPYVFFYTKYPTPRLGEHAQKRFLQVAQATGAVMLYSDYYTEQDGSQTAHPTIDYQLGSVRDDFDFGSILLFRTDVLKNLTEELFRYSVVTSFQELKPERMDVVRALEESLLSFYAVMQEKGIQPEIELPEEPVLENPHLQTV